MKNVVTKGEFEECVWLEKNSYILHTIKGRTALTLMESHDHLAKLVAESHTPDRPEVRAKASIALVAFASELILTTDDDTTTSQWRDAWIGIIRGLGDEWPLVREAFQEQLTKTLDQDKLSVVSQDAFLDQVYG
ncbi:hypothetical protein CPC16_006415 [Podila verticillata]|nr:hypothetical protein CPC16_006415 [Podila verticillata]